MRYVRPATLLALSILVPASMFGQNVAQQSMSITNYQLQSWQIVTRTTASYTYHADLLNAGPGMPSASATLASTVSTVQLVSGQSTLNFSAVPANGQVTANNMFTIIVDRTAAFSFSQLAWTIHGTAPLANAGPNQSGTVTQKITLNGSGSTNPTGTLTYSWAFTTRPPGSSASLTNPASVMPTFVIDTAGTYVVQLTVSNGVASSSASVTITTNNSPPVANAGPNQTVAVGATVHLNGSASSDVDGNSLTYLWTLTSVPPGSTASLTGATTVTPTFVADKPGTYTASLVVNDGLVNSTPATVTITTQNTPPVANAGPNQIVNDNTLVHLDGSGSTDVDGNTLTYSWSLITVPSGSTAVLNSTTAVKPTFTADRSGTFVAQLVVNDGLANSTPSTVTITTNAALAPTANPGLNQSVAHHTTVNLSGSGTDPQNYPLTYSWALISKPTNSTATLSSTTSQTPTFFADLTGNYVAQLTVSDGFLSSAPATVTISTTDTAPIASAGPAQNLAMGATVTLSGSGSSDPDGDPITYSWSLTSSPVGSVATLTGANTVSPTFVADVAGVYVAQLIVNDGTLNSSPATVTITAQQIILTPNPMNLQSTPTMLTITLSIPAGASGNVVNLVSSNPSVASVPASVSVLANATTATVMVTPGSTVSSTTITASANGFASGTVTINVAASTPATITATSGTPQSAMINTAFGAVLKATVKDAGSNPVSGVVVTFAAPASGASGTFAVGGSTATTDVNGIATSGVFTANTSAGTYNVTATVTGVATPANFSLTNTAGAAASITATTGTPQNQTIGTAFTNLLVATVKDASGNPVSGVAVTFAAPGTGASGTFAVGGNTATTNTSGQATSGVFTANTSVGGYTVTATAAGIGTPANFSLTNNAGPAASITATSGGGQTAANGTAFTNPLVATVKDASGNPVSNVVVTFAAPASGASGAFAVGGSTATTNASGQANSGVFTANATSGTYTVTASAPGVSTPASYSLSNGNAIVMNASVTVGVGASATLPVSLSSPAVGVVIVSLTSSDPTKVTVTPNILFQNNATVPNSSPQVTGVGFGSVTITATATSVQTATQTVVSTDTISFNTPTTTITGTTTQNVFLILSQSAPAGGLTFNLSSSNPNVATVPSTVAFTQGSNNANVTITAVSGGTAVIHASMLPNIVDTTITVTVNALGITTASLTSGTTGVAYSQQLTATGGTQPYTWSLPSGTLPTGLSLNPSTGLISGSTSTVVANLPLTFRVTDSSTIPQSANANLTLTIAAPTGPASIAATGGTPQSAVISTAFGSTLMATVKDASNNPVSGAVVTFTAPGSGASGTFAVGGNTATTNASGVAASGTFTANSTAGTYTVSAAVAGVSTPASFSLTNLTGSAASITPTGGTPQNAGINTAFAATLAATVKDAGGNPVSGVTVTFAVQGSGAGGTFAVGGNTATTNASGQAVSGIFTANSFPGSYTVTASTAGVGTPASFSLTNTTVPALISATGGSGQTTTINAAFSAPLTATVKDSAGNLVSGITVTFTVQGTGAGGTFAVGGNTATTNASGQAVSGTLTANNTAGNFTVTAAAAGVGTPASFSLTNSPGGAAAITATGGTPQSAAIGAAFTNPLTATVKDAGGNLVSGAVVTFTVVPVNGAGGSFAGNVTTATTNAAGQATSVAFTANTTVGAYTVTAASGAATGASFALTNVAGAAASITATGGTPASAAINTAFGVRLVATVKDSSNNAVSGAVVTFSAPASGASGTFANNQVSATTDVTGAATSAIFTANATAGAYTVTATVTGVSTPASFLLTNTATAPASIVVSTGINGNNQSTMVGTAFPVSLKVQVLDAGSNPVSGITVTYAAPTSGASGTFPSGNTATTAANGTATIAITANSIAGTYPVTATINGVATPATFTLSNTAGAATQISATGGTPQSTIVGTVFSTPLAATVKDAGGNLVSGATVTFTVVPVSGAGGAFTGGVTATTNASGVASLATFTANTTAGSYTVTAATGAITGATFNLTNTPGAAASISATGGTPQTVGIGSPFPTNLSATVKDTNGNLVPGVLVTFAAPATGASGTFASGGNTATTNASGVATSGVFTANTTLGTYTVTASANAGAITGASFALTNKAGGAASVVLSTGNSQSAMINTAFALPLTVLVSDAGNNPVSGVTVTFAAPASGASGTFPSGNTAVSLANGKASVAFTSNSIVGANYQVTATVSGIATPATFTLSNTPGTAATITATSGAGQTATVGATFTNVFKATVKDAGGNLVSGAVVTFAAPTTGASGSFAAGQTTATTDVNGIATSAAFSANSIAGTYSVTATSGSATSATFGLTNTAGPAAAITATGGTPQSTGILTAFAPLQATVKDASGNPVSGATVTFTVVPVNGAGGTFAGGAVTATTNASGVASSAVFTANSTTGTYSVTAATGSVTGATFALTNSTGAASKVTVLNGNSQSIGILAVFPSPLSVTVTDAGGNLVSNATVTFTAPATGASITFAGSSNTAVSNASGVATSQAITANNTVGANYTVTASVVNGTTSASFTLSNTVGAPAQVTATGGTPQTVSVNSAYAAFSATVKDAGGNPVSGQIVTFTAPSSGASGTFAGALATTAATNASGVATTTPVFTANSTAGSFSVKATTGTATPGTFALTNTAGAAVSVTATTASGTQTAMINTAYALPLAASVVDAGNNPVSNVTVTFVVQGSGGTFSNGGTSITASTNASGVASTVITANSAAGTFGVSGSIPGVQNTTSWTLTNTPGPAAQIKMTSGSGQSVGAGSSFVALVATVTDAFGNGVSGTSVTFAAPGGNPTASFGGFSTFTVSSGANGKTTSIAPIAGSAGGPYTVTATAAGVTGSASFSLTNKTATATVPITVSNVTVGQNLEASVMVSIPSSSVAVTVTLSCDPTKILIGNANIAGSCASQTVTLQPNQTFFTTYVQALQSSGTAEVIASAPGYLTGVGTVTLTPSGFVLSASAAASAIGQPFTANQGVASTLTVFPAQLDTSMNFVAVGQLRGGFSANAIVSVPAGNTVGNISGGTVVISAGSSAGTTTFNPLTPGSVVITVTSPSGFSQANSAFSTITASISSSAITMQPVTVGMNLEATSYISINSAAVDDGVDPNHPGVHITVTSSDPNVRFSLTGTDAGSSSILVLIPIINGQRFTTSQNFYVYGEIAGGTGTVTFTGDAKALDGTANSFTPGSATLTVTPSGFVIGANGALGGSFPTTANSGFTENIAVYPYQLSNDGQLNPLVQQALAGNQTVNVTITNPGATTIGSLSSSTLTVAGGALYAQTVFTPLGAGNDTLTVVEPSGFSTPSSDTTVIAQVGVPGISINDGGSVGHYLQTIGTVGLGSTQGSPTVITLTVSDADYPTLRLSNTGTDAGQKQIQVTVPAGQLTAPQYYIYGFADSGSGTYTVSATGFASKSSTIVYTPSGVVITGGISFGGEYFLTASPVTPTPYTVQVGQLDTNGNFVGAQALAGQVFLTVGVNNANPGVGTTSALLSFPQASSQVTGSFVPVSIGATQLTLTTPFNYSQPNNYQTMSVTVSPALATATGGTPQSAAVGTTFTNPLTATVTDGSGNPIAGAVVTFTVVPVSGAGGTFAGNVNTATTNAAGQAVSQPFTANGTAGSYTVTAAADAAVGATFNLTNH